MADAEDKEKAEKLAAAKKRFEQLKKQQKGKKGGSKKKEEKSEAGAEASASAEKTEDDHADVQADAEGEDTSEVKDSSKSSSRDPADNGLKSPTISGPGESASEIYKKQTLRIEELEKENKQLVAESERHEKRWRASEEELEELRGSQGEVAELKVSKTEAEKLKSELTALQRQNTQLLAQASRKRSVSTASPSNADDLASQVASKTETIQSLELDLSNAQTQISQSEAKNAEQAKKISSLELDVAKTQEALSLVTRELADLKQNLDKASKLASKEGIDRDSAETRIVQLETSLTAAQRMAESTTKRAETLEKKVETLTTLHRESDARHQVKVREHEKAEREAKEVRTRVTFLTNENAKLREASDRHRKAATQGDDGESVDELLDEERRKLLQRIQSLEGENTDLRRGVWRDRRREMQPGLDQGDNDGAAFFDDVDLSTGHSPHRYTQRGSSFTDVIQSGISAFTGQPRHDLRRGSSAGGKSQAQQQLGLVDEDEDEDDFAFDEDAFRKAQEEEGQKRLERVREVKRGLKDWIGWRIDIVDVRAGMGGVFDV